MGQPSHSERKWVQRMFSIERDWLAAPRREEAKLSLWVSTQVGKETYLNFHSSSQLLKDVPTRASWPNPPALRKPSSPASGVSGDPSATKRPHRRRYSSQIQNVFFLTARDFLLNKSCHFLMISGMTKQPLLYCHWKTKSRQWTCLPTAREASRHGIIGPWEESHCVPSVL